VAVVHVPILELSAVLGDRVSEWRAALGLCRAPPENTSHVRRLTHEEPLVVQVCGFVTTSEYRRIIVTGRIR
jgi:hypothetical protein